MRSFRPKIRRSWVVFVNKLPVYYSSWSKQTTAETALPVLRLNVGTYIELRKEGQDRRNIETCSVRNVAPFFRPSYRMSGRRDALKAGRQCEENW